MKDRRFKLLKDIMDKAEEIGANKITLYCLIATMTDRKLTKFHKDFMDTIGSGSVEQPYLKVVSIETEIKYNPNFGDNKECKCGHDYHRHFDSYEGMEATGCKYCGCNDFEEA
jgi:hypothetical protein|tara:strand:- start:3013 stop:3351 length:339 start_codon:yes stop_codon:yes gene_type:complete